MKCFTGHEFLVVIISTVRTFSEKAAHSPKPDEQLLGFLSDSNLLNTALTRAKAQVCVVGDPVALCYMGKCRGVSVVLIIHTGIYRSKY